VIGLGRIGCLVADAAIKLGMHVIGYDPDITVDAAWSLPAQVRKAHSLAELLKASRLRQHPRAAGGRHQAPDQRRGARDDAPQRAVLLNFSREGVVDDNALLAALAAERLRCTCAISRARRSIATRAPLRCPTSAPAP
jgi:D-3-phosphoglycerate dehydrogenase